MATASTIQPDVVWRNDGSDSAVRFATVLVPAGRILFSLIFIYSGINHFSQTTVSYASSQGVPMATVLVPLSGLIAIAGGLSILLGYKARIGALLLGIFLLPVTLMMHDFWNVIDPTMREMQIAHFMKNLALLGASLLICFFGSGPGDLEGWLEARKKDKPKF